MRMIACIPRMDRTYLNSGVAVERNARRMRAADVIRIHSSTDRH